MGCCICVKYFFRRPDSPTPFYFCYIYYYMKYLITQSQLDKIVFKYLENQDFIIKRMNSGNINYFVNSEGDGYADALIQHHRSGDCVISYELINEIATFFSIDFDDSKYVIARWIENTLDRRVKEIIIR